MKKEKLNPEKKTNKRTQDLDIVPQTFLYVILLSELKFYLDNI